jgi:hypothetical protein
MAQIEFTTREKKLILILRKVREDWSYSDIARTLNDILPEDNQRNRSGSGVKKFIARERAQTE